MLLALTNATLTTLFAAIAALAAFGSIIQAGINHKRDTTDREAERRERREQFELEAKERRDEFDRETAERRFAAAEDRRVLLLEQLRRISDRVAVVRETARDEATPEGSLQTAIADVEVHQLGRYFWNARKQLEASLVAYRALGGAQPLETCWDLATGSTVTHLGQVIGACTNAFDELSSATAELGRPSLPSDARR